MIALTSHPLYFPSHFPRLVALLRDVATNESFDMETHQFWYVRLFQYSRLAQSCPG